ncbi:MAG: hypothetical protein GY846_18785 [Deltaproteobacteria bacterium]|nr:hypothetical protein [Deltaproteobacteria bacterium]
MAKPLRIDQDVLVEEKRLTDKRKSELANQTLHQTPGTWAVLAGAGGGAGELGVRRYQTLRF